MTGLTLIGLDDDGAHLVVQDAGGALLRLPVTDELRRAVRRAAVPAAPAAAEEPGATMSPREIQQRLRAGLTAAELAEVSGVPLETIEKFAAPVLAERRYVIDQAQGTRIGRDQGSPVLYDLVMDRLAARGVAPDAVTWEAWRTADEPWKVAADFRIDGRGVRAAWTYDHTARSLTAEDEESRWLTETELLDAPIPRRHLSAVQPASSAPTAPAEAPANTANDRVMSDGAPPSAAIQMPTAAMLSASELSATEALLADLDGRRGTREAMDDVMEDDDEDDASFGHAAHIRTAPVNFGGADASTTAARSGHPAGSALASPAAASHAAAESSEPPAEPAPPTPAGGERKPKKGRSSVPSWDEIVFGARQQQQD